MRKLIALFIGLGLVVPAWAGNIIFVRSAARVTVSGHATLPTSLESYWDLEETSGTRVDNPGTNDLTDNNTVTYVTGKQGNAAHFEVDTTEYLSITDNASISTGDIDWSFACWLNVESYDSGNKCIASHDVAVRSYQFELQDQGSGNFRADFLVLTFDGGSSARVGADTFGNLSTGVWYFIYCYHDASGNEIGISVNDGTVDTTATGGIAPGDADGAFQMGARDGSRCIDASIDEFGFWKKVLSSAEVTDLYNSGDGIPYD